MLRQLLCLGALSATLWALPGEPRRLRVEYLENPMGIDVFKPRLSWILQHDGRNETQTAYRTQLALHAEFQTPIWDSQAVVSAENAHVLYGGPALRPRTRYYWRVQWKDTSGSWSPWSRPAFFETGLESWSAAWLGGRNLLRKELSLPSAPRRARVYVTGIGYYELRLNGRKVGNRVLDPAFTQFEKRVLYSTYDVTSLLQAGPNSIGMMLGNGWYGQTWKGTPAGRLEMFIELADGSELVVGTDSSWKMAAGPVVEDSIYLGETYDARREMPGWDRSGFDDAKWEPARTLDLKPVMSAQAMPPIEVIDTVAPYTMKMPAPGVYVFDLGQNFTGWVRLKVRGAAGERVRIRYAESLYQDGNVNVENLRYARATDYYILRGSAEGEEWEPRFSYHGFRYVELTGVPGVPSLETVRGRIVHTVLRQTGTFAASKPVLNDIERLTMWTLRGNWMSLPTDGAQRDERMGWMADAHLASEAAMLHFDVPALYINFLRNIADEQGENGEVPDVAPHKTFGQKRGDPAWASGYPLFVWYLWERYGDRKVLEDHFNGIRRWADFLATQSSGDLIEYSYYGDWVALERTPGPLVSSVYYYASVDIVAKTAAALGRKEEAARYRAQADRISAAFNKKWLNGDGTYAGGSQTAAVLPLWFGITPEADRSRVAADLLNRLMYHSNTHPTTGIHGTKYLFPLLTRLSRSELAYDLMTSEEYPSFGYMVRNGATTFWELWQHKTGPRMNSHNHPAFSAVGAWLIEGVGGINTDPEGPGYSRIRIEPQIFRDTNWAAASVETIRGDVRCSWKRIDHGAEIEVTIPVGARATIHIPKILRERAEIFEGGKPVWRNDAFVPGVPGLASARQTGYPVHTIVFEAGSGTYRFTMHNELVPQ